jgi:glycerol uptake operon antiterminator
MPLVYRARGDNLGLSQQNNVVGDWQTGIMGELSAGSVLVDPRKNLVASLARGRVIPAPRLLEHIPLTFASPAAIVFMLCGTPVTIGEAIAQLLAKGKLPIANLDLLQGFSQHTQAVEFLAKVGAAGIISTHQHLLRAAISNGLIAVQRTFMLDSAAVENSIRTLKNFQPDIIELLPAVSAPLVLPRLRANYPDLLVTACGLTTNLKQVDELIQHGVSAVSVSDPSLWIL